MDPSTTKGNGHKFGVFIQAAAHCRALVDGMSSSFLVGAGVGGNKSNRTGGKQ
jgi:hypothetical protein